MEPGDRVDRFLVEARLGQGGMATVYRVRHTGLGSPHALKILDLPYPSVRNRLVLEGRVQAGLSHPNIVSVTDLVEVDGAPGLIMEYVPGPSLDVWLLDNRPDVATAAVLFGGILDAVGYAHRQGLIHRDLKPGNVLLHFVDGRVVPKVADFGLAKLMTDDAGPAQTRTGFAMGTPGYMAPEQIRSAKDVDVRADIFALGCILYELWCGARPFHGDSVYDVLVAIERREHRAPRELRPDMPLGVEAAILGCIEPDRDARLPNVDAVRALLDGDRAPPLGAGGSWRASADPPSPVSTLPPSVGERPGSNPTFALPDGRAPTAVSGPGGAGPGAAPPIPPARLGPAAAPPPIPPAKLGTAPPPIPASKLGAAPPPIPAAKAGPAAPPPIPAAKAGPAAPPPIPAAKPPIPAAKPQARPPVRRASGYTGWIVVIVVLVALIVIAFASLFVMMLFGGLAGLGETGM
jgi:serine/threonine protein kinase